MLNNKIGPLSKDIWPYVELNFKKAQSMENLTNQSQKVQRTSFGPFIIWEINDNLQAITRGIYIT
jgi:hypothetical protein